MHGAVLAVYVLSTFPILGLKGRVQIIQNVNFFQMGREGIEPNVNIFFGEGRKRDDQTNAQGEKRGHHHHTYGKLFSKVG